MKLVSKNLVSFLMLTTIIIAWPDLAQANRETTFDTKADNKTAISVIDFAGNKVELTQPAQKIVALAPHIVENVFTAGAGQKLIGAVAYSDYPEQAKQLPLVGGYTHTNLERIIELDPDLVIAWESGNSNSSLERIKELGYTIYVDQPDTLADIAKSIQDIGILAGTSEVADVEANNYLATIRKVGKENKDKPLISAFYQVWNSPLQTINGGHFISAAIELCGGTNIYASEKTIAPIINIESILQRDPEAIIASGMSSAKPEWLDDWLTWTSLKAVKQNNLFFVNPDHIQRHTVRLLKGIDVVCEHLDVARSRHSK